jgi:hypothetical protein
MLNEIGEVTELDYERRVLESIPETIRCILSEYLAKS